jgi:hypothetical protein
LLGSRDTTIVQFHDCEGLQEWTDVRIAKSIASSDKRLFFTGNQNSAQGSIASQARQNEAGVGYFTRFNRFERRPLGQECGEIIAAYIVQIRQFWVVGVAPLAELVMDWKDYAYDLSGSCFASMFVRRRDEGTGEWYSTLGSNLRSLSVSSIKLGCYDFLKAMARNAHLLELKCFRCCMNCTNENNISSDMHHASSDSLEQDDGAARQVRKSGMSNSYKSPPSISKCCKCLVARANSAKSGHLFPTASIQHHIEYQ